MPNYKYILSISLFLSFNSNSAEMCSMHEAARLSKLYVDYGMSGLVAASENCHRTGRNCEFVDLFGYAINKNYCQRSRCISFPYFDYSYLHKRNPNISSYKGRETELLCNDIKILINDLVRIGLQ